MRKTWLWSLSLFLWVGVNSCSDDEHKDGNSFQEVPVTIEIPQGEEGGILPSELTSFDYFVWNATDGQILPIEGAVDGIVSMEGTALQSGLFQLALLSNVNYQVYGMAVRDVDDEAGSDEVSLSARAASSADPRTVDAGVTRDEISAVSDAIMHDMPSFFHYKYVMAYGEGWGTISLQMAYDQFVAKYKLAMEGADEILNRMPEGMGEFERAKWLWDEFLKSVSYGQKDGSEGNIYGAFCIHKVVCEGYARAYQYLCQRAGLQALYVEGTSVQNGSSVSHAWNIIRIDGTPIGGIKL